MQRTQLLVRIAGAIFLLTAVVSGTASAQEIEMSVQTVSAGAVRSASTDDWMAGTLGQPVIGIAQIPEEIGMWGFWYELPRPSVLGIATPGRSMVVTDLRLEVAPNPADDAASIRYLIPTRGHVTLRIVDMLGRQVTTIVNSDHMAGVHFAMTPTAGLPSGSFIIELLHNGRIASHTLTVIH